MDMKEKIFCLLHDAYQQIAQLKPTNNTEVEIQQMAKEDIDALTDKYIPEERW